jgi:1,4-alpha-glucan branching enzyme
MQEGHRGGGHDRWLLSQEEVDMVIRKNKSEVTFVYRADKPAKAVHVVGSFNDWDATSGKMQKVKGEWLKRISLQPGRYEYKFLVDGQWQTDPDASETTRNGFGSDNSVLQLA